MEFVYLVFGIAGLAGLLISIFLMAYMVKNYQLSIPLPYTSSLSRQDKVHVTSIRRKIPDHMMRELFRQYRVSGTRPETLSDNARCVMQSCYSVNNASLSPAMKEHIHELQHSLDDMLALPDDADMETRHLTVNKAEAAWKAFLSLR